MRLSYRSFSRNITLFASASAALVWAAGCTAVGPASISTGRLAYNEAIVATSNQQMLMSVLHQRYSERSNLLAVASVTANVSVTTSAAVQVGAGPSGNFVGNLVPISAGAIYEENPTISYVPVESDKYVGAMMAPVPISVLAEFSTTVIDPAPIFYALISSINGIHNPDFTYPDFQPDPRFDRFVTIMSRLTRMHKLHWVQTEDKHFDIVISQNDAGIAPDVKELLDMLGLPAPADSFADIVLPVFLALEGGDRDGLGITTRSVFRMIEIFAGVVQIPESDVGGAAADYPPVGMVGRDLQIQYRAERPEQAAVAVRYRDGWFYIEDTDQPTKIFFRILGVLWAVVMDSGVAGSRPAPVLTIPVSN